MGRSSAVRAAVTQDIPALVTVPNVELLEAGEDWETMTGVFSFTPGDLVSAIESQQDPSVRTPVIKLGHVDPRFDGQPSLGRVENLRLDNNGQTLVGDLVGVPGWLAQVMYSAFPRRSIEGAFQYTTKTGNTWSFVLTGLALLGDAYPAINTLEDIQALWGNKPPALFPVEEVEEVAAEGAFFRARRIDDMPNWVKKRDNVAASAPVAAARSLDEVRRAYYDTLNSGQSWWWIREIRVDPLELIVDDDEGGLYRVPATVSGDNISFGDPEPIRVEYVAAAEQLIAASYRDPVQSGRTHNKEGSMQLSAEVLQKLGLEADADEDAINTAILQLTASENAGEPANENSNDDGNDGNSDSQPDTPATAPEAQPATAPQTPDGMVLIDEATFQELKEGAIAARQLQKEREKQERDALLDSAIKAGKFPRARRSHYEALLSADPEGTKALIASLAKGVVPVSETGTQGSETDSDVRDNAYPESWKNAVNASRRGVGSRLKVVGD